jgi:hypothetical protein
MELEGVLGKWQTVAWLKFVLEHGLSFPSKTKNRVTLMKTWNPGCGWAKEDDSEWKLMQ